MDEKTEELRDIFVDVAGEETVTESQEAGRGSLARDEEAIEEALRETIRTMRERFDFATTLSVEEYCRVARLFFEEESDTAVADALGTTRETAVRARMDLHLLRDRDLDAPFDLDDLRALADETATDAATDLGVSTATVRRYRRVLAARARSRTVNGRYRRELAELLTDADLGEHTNIDTYDGLREAAEDIEHDMAF
jgi:hypothetical protein